MKQKKKLAALCFFGQARTLKRCYPYIKKYILDPLGENKKDYDIFCCVEDDEDAKNLDLLNPTKVLKIKSENAKKVFKKDLDWLNKYNYRKFVLRIGPRTPHPFENMIQGIYKKKLCYNLLEDYVSENNVEYKYFVRARFDIVLAEEIEINKMKIKKDEIFVPKNEEIRSLVGGIDDCFSVASDLDTFKVYCNVVDNIKNLVLKRHSLSFGFFKKLYFLTEKTYRSFLVRLFKKNKHFGMIFGLLTLIPSVFFYRSMRKQLVGSHTLLIYQMKKNGKKIKEVKVNYAIVRKNDTGYKGILRIEE